MAPQVILERFELLERAGEGGMGAVYRALDRATGGLAAIKILHATADVARFRAEARLLAELRHPHVVRYLADGLLEDGRAFLAMEWLEGETLEVRLRRGPLPLEEAVLLCDRVADALVQPHARGVVHRDLKPENLFLRAGDVRDVRLLDFGVALTAGVRMTRTGGIVGTAGYMSPEQARGARDIDARADVFALGAVLFECVTGQVAFPGHSPLAILAKIALDAPPLLRDFATVPASLDALVSDMLARDLEKRPRDAAELRRRLARLSLSEAPHSSMPPSLRAALGEDELRLVAVVMLRSASSSDAVTVASSDASEVAQRIVALCRANGAEPQVLADGTVVAVPAEAGSATDHASVGAACALALRSESPDLQLGLAIGSAQRDRRVPVGETLARAAFLVGRAAPGTVAVDDACAALLAQRFVVEDGVLVGRRGHGQSPLLLGKRTACVGREAELAQLRSSFERSVGDSASGAAIVSAAAGLGKSRVCRELEDRLHAEAEPPTIWCARLDVTEIEGAYHGARRIVRAALREDADLDEDDALATRAAGFGPHAPFLRELAGIPAPADAALLAGARRDPEWMRHELSVAFQALITRACERGPAVLLIEDAHALDAASLALLDAALRAAEERPLFVAAFTRPEGARKLAEAFGARLWTELRLPPLPKRGAEALVRAALGPGLEPAAINALVQRAAGNAFFLEELIRAAGRGELERAPDSVLAVLQDRFDDLDPAARKALRAASLLEGSLDQAGVEAVSGLSTRECEVALGALVRAELLQSVGGAGRGLSLRHALVGEAAYATLTEEDKRTGHALAAQHLAESGGAPRRIASHFERAGDNAGALVWLVEAAAHAAQLAAFDEVQGCLARATALGQGTREWALIVSYAASTLEWSGANVEAARLTAEALPLVTPGSARWAEVVRAGVCANGRIGALDAVREGTQLLIQALGRADVEREGVLVTVAAVCAQLESRSLRSLARDLRRAAWGDQPTREDEPDPRRLVLDARDHLAAGDIGRFVAWTERVARAYRAEGDERRALVQDGNRGYALGELGRYEEAEAALSSTVNALERLDLRAPLAGMLQNLGLVQARLGDHAAAIRSLRASWSAFAAQRSEAMATISLSLLGEALFQSGAREEGIARSAEALRSAPVGTAAAAHACAVHATLLLSTPDGHPQALEHARAGMVVLDELGALPDGEMRLRLAHARALARSGDAAAGAEVARRAREVLEARAARITDPVSRASFLSRVVENAAVVALTEGG